MKTSAKREPYVEIISDAEGLAHRVLEVFVAEAEKTIKSKGVFRVAISGGHTPRRFFELLGQTPKALRWEKIQLFWVDERYVPPDSQWSNYKLAVDNFLEKVAIPKENVHRIPTEHSDFAVAAREYEESIRKAFGLKKKQIPQFDLIMLGMTDDGHMGSLFANSFASLDDDNLACVVYVLDEKLNRITLTHPVLRAAARLIVMVSGEEKAQTLKKVLTDEPDEVKYPIHALWPVLDKVTWLVDSKAAKCL